jgi:hypothetical protein
VKSYEVLSVDVRNREAVVMTLYVTLAKSDGEGFEHRDLVYYCRERDKVLLKLSRQRGTWRIIDPPIPRVSKEAMLSKYQASVRRYEENIDKPQTSKAQKSSYQKVLETLKFLEAL